MDGFPVALVRSRFFWQDTLPFIVIALLCAATLLAIAASRFALRRGNLWRDQRGSVVAFDLVLTLPFFLLVAFLMVQMALLARASFLVHYAAYSAARSARVVAWEPLGPLERKTLDFLSSGPIPGQYIELGGLAARWMYGYYITERIPRMAYQAGCLSLASIGSSDPRLGAPRADTAAAVSRYIEGLQGVFDTDVIRRKVNYSCDKRFTTVEVEPEIDTAVATVIKVIKDKTNPARALPVRATVTFRYYLDLPVGVILGSQGPGGHYYRTLTAEATVL